MPNRSLHSLTAALLTALVVLAAQPGRARAETAPRVGIVVSLHVNLKKSEAQKLSTALGRALHRILVVDVVAGAEADRRLPADGVSESCVVDQACIKDIAQRLSADQILLLVAVRVGSRIQVDSTWVDPATGRSASRPKVVMVKVDEAEERFAEAASLILPEVQVRPTQVDEGGGAAAAPFLVRTTPRHMTVGSWIFTGVGAAALVAGGIFTYAADREYGDCDDRKGTDNPCSDSELDAVKRNAIAADVLIGGAVLSAGVAALLYYTSGGEIERIPAAARGLRLHIGRDGGAFVSMEGSL